MSLDKVFQIALIGRTNVGKSTLFNRLSRSRKALVFDRKGVTRDLKKSKIEIFDKEVDLLDVPGMFDYEGSDNTHPALLQEITKKVNEAIMASDLIIFVIDAESGISLSDKEIAKIVRQSNKNTIVAVNKSDKKGAPQRFIEAMELGFRNTIQISAEHGLGMDDLYECIYSYVPENFKINEENLQEKIIKFSIIGRPNVGKSTLINTLLKKDVQLVADMDGVTRESAEFDFDFNGTKIKLIDTPGVRKKAKITDMLEKISATTTKNAYKNADVVILIVDAKRLEVGELERQDISLAAAAIAENKPIVIAFNKLDSTPYGKNQIPEFLIREMEKNLSQLKHVPFLFISATKKINIDKMLEIALSCLKKNTKKTKTVDINNVLEIINNSDIMQSGSAKFKLKFATQVAINPPTFVIFTNKKDNIKDFHKRFIINSIKDQLNLKEIPIKVIFKDKKKIHYGKDS